MKNIERIEIRTSRRVVDAEKQTYRRIGDTKREEARDVEMKKITNIKCWDTGSENV